MTSKTLAVGSEFRTSRSSLPAQKNETNKFKNYLKNEKRIKSDDCRAEVVRTLPDVGHGPGPQFGFVDLAVVLAELHDPLTPLRACGLFLSARRRVARLSNMTHNTRDTHDTRDARFQKSKRNCSLQSAVMYQSEELANVSGHFELLLLLGLCCCLFVCAQVEIAKEC
jgi:hypothetical protein